MINIGDILTKLIKVFAFHMIENIYSKCLVKKYIYYLFVFI